MAVAVMAPIIWLGWFIGFTPLEPQLPDSYQWVLLLSIGGLGTIAHLLMTWSLRYAPSATLAPMQYLEIPFATLLGWLIFSDLPNRLAGVGIVITMASGLYIILREQATARTLAQQVPTQPA